MEITLPAELRCRVEEELAAGQFRNADELIEFAVREFLDEQRRALRRRESLRRIGGAVDRAGFYERVLVPGP